MTALGGRWKIPQLSVNISQRTCMRYYAAGFSSVFPEKSRSGVLTNSFQWFARVSGVIDMRTARSSCRETKVKTASHDERNAEQESTTGSDLRLFLKGRCLIVEGTSKALWEPGIAWFGRSKGLRKLVLESRQRCMSIFSLLRHIWFGACYLCLNRLSY